MSTESRLIEVINRMAEGEVVEEQFGDTALIKAFAKLSAKLAEGGGGGGGGLTPRMEEIISKLGSQYVTPLETDTDVEKALCDASILCGKLYDSVKKPSQIANMWMSSSPVKLGVRTPVYDGTNFIKTQLSSFGAPRGKGKGGIFYFDLTFEVPNEISQMFYVNGFTINALSNAQLTSHCDTMTLGKTEFNKRVVMKARICGDSSSSFYPSFDASSAPDLYKREDVFITIHNVWYEENAVSLA